ncbi:MAG: cbb3-type cytochrome c oxidase subunit I [Ilumatobacteraceae bacterium]
MTTIDTHATDVVGSSTTEALSGIVGWITTTDHKRVGRMFIGGGLLALAGVSVVGVLLGIDRASTSKNLIDVNALPQLFSIYRVGLIFIVLLPILVGLAVAVVPLQLGARSLAFPRLAASGFWTWMVGAVLVIGSIAANGGPGGGDRRMVAGYLVAQTVVLLGLLAAAVCVATSVMTTRAPGMNMRRVPPFSFSALVGAIGVIIGVPVLVGALLYSYVDYRYGGSGFGQSKDIFSHIGFGFSQPLTFVFAVPAFGIAAEAIAVATRKRLPMRGVMFTGFGLVGLGALGAVVQVPAGLRRDIVHVSFGTALNDIVPYVLINLLPVLGGLIVLGVGALALAAARPRVTPALVFGLLGSLLVFGGLLGNAVYLIGDAQLGGTVFEEGVRLLVAYGAVLAGLGGIAHWAPKLWGRAIAVKAVLPLALLGFLGAVLAAVPYLVAGFAKQPGDSTTFDYGGPEQLWNIAAAVGHLLMLLTVLAFVGLAMKSFGGRSTPATASGDDPWDAQTLEWATSSPAPFANFAEIHTIASAEPLLDLKEAAGRNV